MIPVIIKIAPIIMLLVNGSCKTIALNTKPNTGTSNVEIVALAISIKLNMTNQTVKLSAEANKPVNNMYIMLVVLIVIGSFISNNKERTNKPPAPKSIWNALVVTFGK